MSTDQGKDRDVIVGNFTKGMMVYVLIKDYVKLMT